jgi:hypothetical protein
VSAWCSLGAVLVEEEEIASMGWNRTGWEEGAKATLKNIYLFKMG